MNLRDWLGVATVATQIVPDRPTVAKVTSVASNEDSAPEPIGPTNPNVQRRRNRALAILADEPERHIPVVAEPGEPAHVTVAIRGVAVGDLKIPAERYDGFALLALMQQYGHA